MRYPIRTVVLVAGLLATLAGLLFIGQGLGYIHWPLSSPMLDQRAWANRGAMLAVGGLLLLMVGRRLRR